MSRSFLQWLLPVVFIGSLLLSSLLFKSRPPRMQPHLALLQNLISGMRKTHPQVAVQDIQVRGLSQDYRIWMRYFAAPSHFALDQAGSGDTVLLLESSTFPDKLNDHRIYQAEEDSFCIALLIQP